MTLMTFPFLFGMVSLSKAAPPSPLMGLLRLLVVLPLLLNLRLPLTWVERQQMMVLPLLAMWSLQWMELLPMRLAFVAFLLLVATMSLLPVGPLLSRV
jgi:hypothetical protein